MGGLDILVCLSPFVCVWVKRLEILTYIILIRTSALPSVPKLYTLLVGWLNIVIELFYNFFVYTYTLVCLAALNDYYGYFVA